MRPLLILILLVIPVAAQAPLLRLPVERGTQLRAIAERQIVLAREYEQLEQAKLTIKYRACLELKMDAERCDAMDAVAEGDGFVFKAKPDKKGTP